MKYNRSFYLKKWSSIAAVAKNSRNGGLADLPFARLLVYIRDMRKTFALATVLAAGLSLTSATIAGAATYPPSVNHVTLNTSTIVIGSAVTPITDPLIVKKATSTTSTPVDKPIRILIGGLKAGATVSSTLKGPNGKVITLPKLVVNANGTLDTKAIAFKTPGKYVITYKLPNGSTRTVTITVA